jgi:alkylation response protein AidB-like acyl-CoA dehydrogenase
MVVANALIALPLWQTASAGLKGEWLPRIIAGEAVGACAVAEEGIGKAGLRTTATPTKGGFKLNGSKHFVANATEAHAFIVSAREVRGDGGSRGDHEAAREGDQTALFLVPRAAKGVKIGKNPSTLGLRPIPLADVHFQDTLVPADHKLAEGPGADVFRDAWALGKLGSGAISVGLAQAALERAVQFAQQRNQFGRPIAQFEAIQHYVAEMELETKAARALVLSAAGSRDDGKEWQPEAHAARLFAAQAATKTTKLSIRVHGGAGYMRELPVERYARDARTLNHFAETLDAAKTIVGKRLLGLG